MSGKKTGVVLLNLGGPTSEEAVRKFLRNLFLDPDIIKLGGGFAQKLLAGFISGRRAGPVAKRYKEINTCAKGCVGNKYCPNQIAGKGSECCSPINPLTEAQRAALEKVLQAELEGRDVKVYTAMRYWIPFTETILKEMKADGIEEVVLLPLYPQFSWTTSGSSFNEWEQEKARLNIGGQWREYQIKDYRVHPMLLDAISERIDDALAGLSPEKRRQTHIVFSAHGTPLSEVRSGDPYTQQVRDTVEAIMRRPDRNEQYWLGFQSKVGPAKWTKPSTEELVRRLLGYGIKNILLVPVAFVTDHIETVMELGIELKEEMEDMDYENLLLTEGLNTHPKFIGALAELTCRMLEESQRAGNGLAEHPAFAEIN